MAERVYQYGNGVEVRYAGPIERGARYRWTDGYAVVVDGRMQYPWTGLREAQRAARTIATDRKKGAS